jgi:hypothetical protein
VTRFTVPWSEAEARTSFAFAAAGAALIVWAWWGSSGRASADGTEWFACGIAGLGVLCFGALTWVMAGRRAVGDRREALEERVVSCFGARPMPADEARALHVILQGSTRYHRRECLLVAGKRTTTCSEADEGSASLLACEMCRP